MNFCDVDFLLNDAPQLGRPSDVDSNQLNTLFENNQHYTTQEITNIFQISKMNIEQLIWCLAILHSIFILDISNFDVWFLQTQ